MTTINQKTLLITTICVSAASFIFGIAVLFQLPTALDKTGNNPLPVTDATASSLNIDKPTAVDMEKIISQNIFTANRSNSTAIAPALHPKSSLKNKKLILKGIFCYGDLQGAIIQVDNLPGHLYHLNTEITPGLILKTLSASQVKISGTDGEIVLELYKQTEEELKKPSNNYIKGK